MIEIINAEDPPMNARSALKTRIDQRDQTRSRKSPTAVVMAHPAKPSITKHITTETTLRKAGAPGWGVGTNKVINIARPNRIKNAAPSIAAIAASVTPSGRLTLIKV
jgi:hypothetical protein